MVTAKQRAARALFAKRARAGSFRRAGSRVRRRLRRSRGSTGGLAPLARRRRAAGRIRRAGRRLRRGVHRVSTKTRLVNTIALVIGASPVIERGMEAVQSQSIIPLRNGLMEDYTGFDIAGGFNATRLARGWGPLIAAIVFKKAMAKLKASKLIF